MKDKLKNDEFIFDQKAIKYLADIVNKSSLTEAEYTCGEISIRFSKQVNMVAAPMQQQMMQPAATAAIAQPAPVQAAAPAASSSAQAQANDSSSSETSITAPVVGKVYISPKPGEPAFIKEGDMVKEGQVIFIIEAMKVMNNVKADKAGKVKQILVEDGKPVEYGQKLVILE